MWSVFAGKGVVEVYIVGCVACACCGCSVAFGRLGCVCGMSRRILAAVANSSSVSGMMSLMGAWSQAPEPVPLVEWWTPIALGFSALVRVVMWSFRTSEVSCFCWCLRVMVSVVISVMSCQRAGSTLLVAVWSCALVLGSSFRSSPMVLWPV